MTISTIIASRKRSRRSASWIALISLASLLPCASAIAVQAKSRKLAGSSEQTIHRPATRKTLASPVVKKHADTTADQAEDNVEESLKMSVSGFLELQQSTGFEILPAELQRQIDESIARPDDFLDKHVADASELEKMAMSSITAQLPRAAVQALNVAQQRVTRQEEIQLARQIQQGAQLHRLRMQLEDTLKRGVSKQEWADSVGLSAKELRRQVATYRKAKHDLVTANMGLVHAVVNQRYGKYDKSLNAELVQEGSLGLIRAAELFDPERGLRFSTYAVVWIKGILSNSHISELVRLPDREKTKWNKIKAAEHNLAASGSKATAEELAAVTSLSIQEVLQIQRQMFQARAIWSLDYEYSTQSRSGAEDASATASLERLHKDRGLQDDADLAERTQMRADIIAAMARNLDTREARLMRLRYGLSDGQTRSLQECADAMGLSYTRVHQLSKRCLTKLREAAEASSLEEYLLTIA